MSARMASRGIPAAALRGSPRGIPRGSPRGSPRGIPRGSPSRHPSRQPTRQPTRHPSRQPTRQPTRHPSRQPTRQPTRQPLMPRRPSSDSPRLQTEYQHCRHSPARAAHTSARGSAAVQLHPCAAEFDARAQPTCRHSHPPRSEIRGSTAPAPTRIPARRPDGASRAARMRKSRWGRHAPAIRRRRERAARRAACCRRNASRKRNRSQPPLQRA